MRPAQPSVVTDRHHVMLSAAPSSGTVNTMITITGIGDHDRPEWLIRINGIRTAGEARCASADSLEACRLNGPSHQPVATPNYGVARTFGRMSCGRTSGVSGHDPLGDGQTALNE